MPNVDSWWDELVRDRYQAILELVVRAIADDYENLEIILTTINGWAADPDIEPWQAMSALPVSRREVVSALRELTREGYAQSFILVSHEPHAQPVEFQAEDVRELWFYVTLKGLRTVQQLNGDALSNP